MLPILAMLKQRDFPAGLPAGSFFAGAAVLMAIQTAKSYRNGFMYCGVTEKVYRNQNPLKFKIWLAIQSTFVLLLAAFSLCSFLG
ncbi:MAG TPA: hypothetical protein VGB68_03010 [Pyrinomonadaceae bacterium]|jgi:hypothetical protein